MGAARTRHDSITGKCLRLWELAERQGFEPWVQLLTVNFSYTNAHRKDGCTPDMFLLPEHGVAPYW